MNPVIAEFPGDSKRLCPSGHADKMLWPRALPRNMLPVEAWLERRPDDTHGNGIFGNYGDRELTLVSRLSPNGWKRSSKRISCDDLRAAGELGRYNTESPSHLLMHFSVRLGKSPILTH